MRTTDRTDQARDNGQSAARFSEARSANGRSVAGRSTEVRSDAALPRRRLRISVLFVSENPERFKALQQSALAGRGVHLWVPDGVAAPEWSEGLRGDPEKPATYEPLRGRDVIAIIDLPEEGRAQRVARAISDELSLPSVLVIDRAGSGGGRHGAVRDGVTWIDESELLADAVESVLKRMAGRRRLHGLRAALDGSRSCAFLVQNDPDPDAIASSLALRQALGFRPEHSPIVTLGQITRPENQRLISALGVKVRHVERAELKALGPLILVDVQPPYFRGSLPAVAAVIDHHPSNDEYEARYRDVRTWFGASATMATEYLLAEHEAPIGTALATALLYGIITDTKSLSRAASDEDLEMFAYLFPRADHALLRRIQHPSYGPLALKRLGQALQHARVRDGLAYVHLGKLPADQEHIVAQLAEFCLGMEGATVSAVSGVFGSNLVMSTRALSPSARLGDHLRTLFASYGSAGGHPVMAKTVIDLKSWRADHPFTDQAGLERTVRKVLLAEIGGRGERKGKAEGRNQKGESRKQ
jgi:nanoRNase/pAp phosphatase (c-di-AMP/oligoRNAs hydrolase)